MGISRRRRRWVPIILKTIIFLILFGVLIVFLSNTTTTTTLHIKDKDLITNEKYYYLMYDGIKLKINNLSYQKVSRVDNENVLYKIEYSYNKILKKGEVKRIDFVGKVKTTEEID